MKWRLRDAVDQRLRTKWVQDQPSATTIIKMARVAKAIRVRDAEELQEAIICSFERLQSTIRIGEFPRLPEFWLEPGSKPKAEREISRTIAGWLQQDLSGDAGAVIDREAQVGFRGNVDVKVELPATRTPNTTRLLVIIEVKRCTHADVRTACATQLAEGYLRRKAIPHGIYVVAWFGLPESQLSWGSHREAQEAVNNWASRASDSAISVRGFVLDCRWKDMESPSSIGS
jgi:hypothetical protein